MTDGEIPGSSADGTAEEWWRKPAPPPPGQPPRVPSPRAEPPGGPGPGGSGPADDRSPEAVPGEGGAQPWLGIPGIRSEWADTWPTQAPEGIAAAHEIGAYIGDAITAHLPDPHAAAAKRGLDLRWLGLKYNIPGVLIAALVTWGGHSGVDRMTSSISRDGLFAPLGVVLLFGLLIGVLMVLPVGAVLGSMVSHVVSAVTHGLVRLVGRAWSTPYIGYVLRVFVAVVAWSFVLAVVRIAGRGLIHFMTGA